MKNTIILHGTLGSPDGNWFKWLKNELETKKSQVWLPMLPHAEQPSLKDWAEYVHANCPFAIDEETLIVGHSSGAILALILAQQNNKPACSFTQTTTRTCHLTKRDMWPITVGPSSS